MIQGFRLATSAYPIEALPGWDALYGKLNHWLGQAAGAGVELAVLPEYAGMEAALASGARAETNDEWCLLAAETAVDYAAICRELAMRHGLYLLAGSMPEMTDGGLVNRARFYTPEGAQGFQDKQILTPWERENTPMVSGAPLSAFETGLGRIGALICYDCEFPVLASALAADVLLVPSCTEAHAGMSRVQIGSRARALEGQCYVAHAPLVGAVEHCELVDSNTGQAGIYGPPDTGFPEDGVVAAGESDSPGWVLADLEAEALIKTRQQGAVAPLAHGTEAKACGQKAVHRPLSQKHP